MLARALIVLLLILNLGVALWWATRGGEPATVPDVALPPGSERLHLLEEATAAATPAATAAPTPDAGITDTAGAIEAEAPPPSPSAPVACFAFGPFADVAARDRASAVLAPSVRRLAPREVRTAARGWDVRLVGLADRETANATAARLAAAGFKDHYILPAAGVGTMDIALGRFGSEASAQRHQAALRGAGFDAIAGPIGETGAARHWIDVEATTGFDVVGLRRVIGAAQAERIGCDALAKAP